MAFYKKHIPIVDNLRILKIQSIIPQDILLFLKNSLDQEKCFPFFVGGTARYIDKRSDDIKDIDIAVQDTTPDFQEYKKLRCYILNNHDITDCKNAAPSVGGNQPHLASLQIKGFMYPFDIFPVISIRDYIETVPTAWDGVGFYIRDTTKAIWSKDYENEENYIIYSRSVTNCRVSHFERQILLSNIEKEISFSEHYNMMRTKNLYESDKYGITHDGLPYEFHTRQA